MTLQLANNKIGEAGAVALLNAARQSGTLITLDLRGNTAAMRANGAHPTAFKEELGCNLLLIHALGPRWPAQSTVTSAEAIDAALQVLALTLTLSHSLTLSLSLSLTLSLSLSLTLSLSLSLSSR